MLDFDTDVPVAFMAINLRASIRVCLREYIHIYVFFYFFIIIVGRVPFSHRFFIFLFFF